MVESELRLTSELVEKVQFASEVNKDKSITDILCQDVQITSDITSIIELVTPVTLEHR